MGIMPSFQLSPMISKLVIYSANAANWLSVWTRYFVDGFCEIGHSVTESLPRIGHQIRSFGSRKKKKRFVENIEGFVDGH